MEGISFVLGKVVECGQKTRWPSWNAALQVDATHTHSAYQQDLNPFFAHVSYCYSFIYLFTWAIDLVNLRSSSYPIECM